MSSDIGGGAGNWICGTGFGKTIPPDARAPNPGVCNWSVDTVLALFWSVVWDSRSAKKGQRLYIRRKIVSKNTSNSPRLIRAGIPDYSCQLWVSFIDPCQKDKLVVLPHVRDDLANKFKKLKKIKLMFSSLHCSCVNS